MRVGGGGGGGRRKGCERGGRSRKSPPGRPSISQSIAMSDEMSLEMSIIKVAAGQFHTRHEEKKNRTPTPPA